MAADVRLVARAAQRNADVLAPERFSDALGDGGFADAGGSGKEENRSFIDLFLFHLALGGAVGLEFANRQVFDHAIFDLFQPVVVFVQNLRRDLASVSRS